MNETEKLAYLDCKECKYRKESRVHNYENCPITKKLSNISSSQKKIIGEILGVKKSQTYKYLSGQFCIYTKLDAIKKETTIKEFDIIKNKIADLCECKYEELECPYRKDIKLFDVDPNEKCNTNFNKVIADILSKNEYLQQINDFFRRTDEEINDKEVPELFKNNDRQRDSELKRIGEAFEKSFLEEYRKYYFEEICKSTVPEDKKVNIADSKDLKINHYKNYKLSYALFKNGKTENEIIDKMMDEVKEKHRRIFEAAVSQEGIIVK